MKLCSYSLLFFTVTFTGKYRIFKFVTPTCGVAPINMRCCQLLQETTATFLTASLASRMAEPLNATSTTLPTQGGSSALENASASSSQSGNSGASGFANSTDLVAQQPSSMRHDETPKTSEEERSNLDSSPGNRTVQERPDSASTQVKVSLPDHSRNINIDGHPNPNQTDSTTSLKRKNKVDEGSSKVLSESAPITTTSRGKSLQLSEDRDKAITANSTIKSAPCPVKSNNVQLVIRMSDGPSLQIKLMKDDNLRKVKDFVDENRGSGAVSYDLAMLYPRKVFTEQDMDTTLCDLGIETRQALIVVPHRQAAKRQSAQSSSSPRDGDNNPDGSGYFGYLRTVLSYVNPLSYVRGNPASSNPEQLATEGSEQYRPSSRHANPPGADTGSDSWAVPDNGNQDGARDNNPGSTLRRRTRHVGGNIHSLRSEEQGPSDDRNVYWNGNSTEFGGNDKK
ncbi:hypothetical protein GUJ93_ZPchr0011g27451 [Zizania palustris]|uniref:UBX domain-containing protein n=1 Tax=Zizania palustris TaxID=103762 RepID=A0A8J6BQC5_ZIZPA|nr:hypothetical protein GUJ93_ZPchr0011g27451 [Zizania palustris]